ncbi:hypothetical protein E2C01_009827 [Portunus trituberculatus]|uniref:Uncharacterized protein n=1 Tax=Portunus trituberculatus TaxID=210409 RepID=A0A5B7D711_PORTR|nr:hypothetical protein [Portunus trituberculatus]
MVAAMAEKEEGGGEWVRVGWAALDVNEGRIDTNCPSYTSRFGLSFPGGRLYLFIFFIFHRRRPRDGMRAEHGSFRERGGRGRGGGEEAGGGKGNGKGWRTPALVFPSEKERPSTFALFFRTGNFVPVTPPFVDVLCGCGYGWTLPSPPIIIIITVITIVVIAQMVPVLSLTGD